MNCVISQEMSLSIKMHGDLEKNYKICLPNRESFCSNLVIHDVSKPNYQHAENVRNIFEMRNSEDYHYINVQIDKLFLVDIFQKKIVFILPMFI